MSVDEIVQLYKSVKQHSFLDKEIHFFLDLSRLTSMKNLLEKYYHQEYL